MRLYLAGLANAKKLAKWVLETYDQDEVAPLCTYAAPRQLDNLLEVGFTKNILLDSGAFSAWRSGVKIDIDEYIEYIKKYQPLCENMLITCLDAIGDEKKSIENWEYMRSKGIECVPVWHIGESYDTLDYYAAHAEVVGIGGLIGLITHRFTNPILEQVFLRHPNLKTHGFGVVDFRTTQRFPFFSCDALTWRGGSRFGELVTPMGRIKVGKSQNWGWDVPGVKEYLIEKWEQMGFEEELIMPFPDDFDYNILDKINIQALYEEIVLHNNNSKHSDREELSLTVGLF